MAMKNKRIDAEQAFSLLVGVALAGERCPKAGTDGITSQLTSDLARRGHIRIDVYPHNYRVITILTGPNAGIATKPPTDPKWKPYLTIEQDRPSPYHPRVSP